MYEIYKFKAFDPQGKLVTRKKYEFLNHTADVEYLAYGKTLEECFKNAFAALFETISYTKKVSASRQKVVKFKIKDKAKKLDDLLWYALQDTLSIADAKELFAYRISSLKITKQKDLYKISAVITGKSREESQSKLDAKGIARYNLKVETKGNEIIATVVIDV